MDVGCIILGEEALAALENCTVLGGLNGSRLACAAGCTELAESEVPGSTASAFLQGLLCHCCADDTVLLQAVRAPAGSCDAACIDQEVYIYGAGQFAMQFYGRGPLVCGGSDPGVYSAFRQRDGLSALGRRGAYAPKFALWYEAVVVQLPAALRTPPPLTPRWLTYEPFSHALHGVQVDSGWPVFVHQLWLPLAAECLHADGLSGRIVALARTRAGGIDVVVLCPGCDEVTSPSLTTVDFVEALDGLGGAYVAGMPACTFDVDRRVFSFIAQPAESSELPWLVEVDLTARSVQWRSTAAAFAEAVALEQCSFPGETRKVVALLLSPGGAGSRFGLAAPDALNGTGLVPAGLGLPDCHPANATACMEAGPNTSFVQLGVSAAHGSLPFVFVATEGDDGPEAPDSARLSQLRCDGVRGGGQPALPMLWPSNVQAAHRRRGALLESPFNRRAGLAGMVAAPKLLSAEFTTSGRTVVATFDRATLMGSVPWDSDRDGVFDSHDPLAALPQVFSCGRILLQKTLDHLGLHHSNCSWQSAEVFVVHLLFENVVTVGDALTVQPAVIYGFAPPNRYSPPGGGSIFIGPPAQTQKPLVRLAGARDVDACSIVELDATPSLYATSRPTVTWSVLEAHCGATWPCNFTAVEAAAASASGSSSRVLRLLPAQRPPGLAVLVLNVSLRTMWGDEDFSVVQVTIHGDPRPLVKVMALPSVTSPALGAALGSRVDQSWCADFALGFRWRMVQVRALPSSSSAAADALAERARRLWDPALGNGWRSTSLLLPPGSLAAGVSYDFELRVASADEGYSSNASVTLVVEPSDFVVDFRPPLVTSLAGDDVEVDASGSFDPDDPQAAVPTPAWRCAALDPGTACPQELVTALVAGPPACAFSKHGEIAWPAGGLACRPRVTALRVRGGVLAPGARLQLLAEIRADVVPTRGSEWWVEGGLVPRKTEASCEVVVLSDARKLAALGSNTSNTSIEGISAWIGPLHRLRLGAHESLRLEGFSGNASASLTSLALQGLGGASGLEFSWAVERLSRNPSWDSEYAVFYGRNYTVPHFLFIAVPGPQVNLGVATAYGSSLGLAPYTFAPGARYRFVLRVSYGGLPVAMSAAELSVVRSRPYTGTFTVEPTVGTAGNTTFVLECVGWTAEDDALPLLYDFGYVTGLVALSPVEARLGAAGAQASLRTKDLPPGRGDGSRLALFVDVYTAYGGVERATVQVEVKPPLLPELQLGALSPGDFLAGLHRGDPVLAVARLPLLVSVLEAADRGPLENGSDVNDSLSNSSETTDVIVRGLEEALVAWSSAAGLITTQGEVPLLGTSPPSWPAPLMSTVLVLLLSALRVICGALPSAAAVRVLCAPRLGGLLPAVLPEERLAPALRERPEVWPPPLLEPEGRLPEALLRTVADLLVPAAIAASPASPASRRLSLAADFREMSRLVSTLEATFQVMAPRLAPGEPFLVRAPGFDFATGRDVNLGEPPHVLAPLVSDVAPDILNPTGWLFVSMALLPLLGLPQLPSSGNASNATVDAGAGGGELAVVADWGNASLAPVPAAAGQLGSGPLIALVALGDSYGMPRSLAASVFAAPWRALGEPPATCFRWQTALGGGIEGDRSGWTLDGLWADEGGGCRISVGPPFTSSVLLGLFPDATPERLVLLGKELLMGPPVEGGPGLVAAFSGFACLLAANGLLSIASRLMRRGSQPFGPPVLPSGWPLKPGHGPARLLPDMLVYGRDEHDRAVRLWRSWLLCCRCCHLLFGVSFVDQKVTLQQRAAVLCCTAVAACGAAAVLVARLRCSAVLAAGISGSIAWPFGLLVRSLYEWRPWYPTDLDPNEEAESVGVEEATRAVAVVESGMRAHLRQIEDPQFCGILPTSAQTAASGSSSGGEELTDAAGSPAADGSAGDAQKGSARLMPFASGSAGWAAPRLSRLGLAMPRARSPPRRKRALVVPTINTLDVEEEHRHLHDPLRPAIREAWPEPAATRSGARAAPARTNSGGSGSSTFSPSASEAEDFLRRRRIDQLGLFGCAASRGGERVRSNGAHPLACGLIFAAGPGPQRRCTPSGLGAVDTGATALHPGCYRYRLGGAGGDDGRGAGLAMRMVVPSSERLPRASLESCSAETARAAVMSNVRDLAFDSLLPVRRFLRDLHHEERALNAVADHLDKIKAVHIRGLSQPSVQEYRGDLPEHVPATMLWLGHAAALCITWAGCAIVALHGVWLFATFLDALRYCAAVLGSWLAVCLWDLLRMGLIVLQELARLETRRVVSQGGWFRANRANVLTRLHATGELVAADLHVVATAGLQVQHEADGFGRMTAVVPGHRLGGPCGPSRAASEQAFQGGAKGWAMPRLAPPPPPPGGGASSWRRVVPTT